MFQQEKCTVFINIKNHLLCLDHWIDRVNVYCCVLQKDVAVEVNGEMAAILQSSRFFPDFTIQMLDEPESSSESTTQVSDIMGLLAKVL